MQQRPTLAKTNSTHKPARWPAADGAPAQERAWVLIVEDDAETRAVLGTALDDEGYIVAEAPDGLAAIEVLRVSPYPLVVVLDYWMPRVDGAQVIDTVLHDPALMARHAFVLVTAAPEILPPGFGEALARLRAPLVPKPFDIETLLAAVAAAAARLPDEET